MLSFEKVDMLYGKNDGAWVSLQADLYMTHENQVFIVNVVIIDSTQEMVATSVISQLEGAAAKFNTIVKVHKYKGLHEKHHFIPMAMEMHDALGCDMDHFIRKCACLFDDKQSRDHLILFVYI